jgi:glycosyltransferase involved in cell wall biosynthesis
VSGPAVTIGLPVYNGQNYLEQAIDSLLAQSFEDFRLIIADNASSDSTEEICREAASLDGRVEYHRHDRNLGAAANYNYTVELATGPYFMWHAHDDLRAPEFLERAVHAHETTDGTSIVFSRARVMGPQGELGDEIARPDGLLSARDDQRLRAAITCRMPDIVLFGLMRREYLVQTGRHGAFKGGDRLLVAEMGLLGPFVEISETMFYNRDHPDRYVRMSGKGASRQEKMAWWDTSTGDKITLPRWTGYVGYWKAVHEFGRGGVDDRLRSYLAIISSLGADRFYVAKQLARDLWSAGALLASRLVRRLFVRSSPSDPA